MPIHLIKLVVGVSELAEFAEIQQRGLVDYKGGMANTVWTRHRPRREDELLDGGALYRVIKNRILCRQRIIGFEQAHHPEKGKMCLIMCAPEIIRVRPVRKRPFQGWRYLEPAAAPKDLGPYDSSKNQDNAPPDMADALSAAGLL